MELDALIVAEALRAGSATGWITGWPVTAEAVTLIVPDAPRRMFIQHFNHLPLARQIAHDTEVLWGAHSGISLALSAIAATVPNPRRVETHWPSDTRPSRRHSCDMRDRGREPRLCKGAAGQVG